MTTPLRLPSLTTHGEQRPTLARLFALGATLVALLSIGAIALGSVALVGLTQSRTTLLDRVAPALESGRLLSVALLDQETGVRGYSLSGRTEFLGPYQDGLLGEAEALRELRGLLSSGAFDELAEDVDEVESSVRTWRTRFAEPSIEATEDGTRQPDPVTGRELFDEVRADTRMLVDDLLAAQNSARDNVTAASLFLLVAAIAVAVVLVAVLVAAAVGLRRAVLTPVSGLARQVRAVVSGDTQREVRAAGPREIEELGADVDAMRLRILRDVDDAQEATRRIDGQARDLERSNRDLEQFAYVASHDLQEPLRKVSSFCQLLQRRYGGQLDDRADQYIEFAVDGAQRMQRLINDLLAFSRVGRTTDDFTEVALDDVAAAVVPQLEATRAELDGRIVVHPLPTVTGDTALLRQLLLNLVGNGLKFHRDGVPPVVEVSGVRAEGAVVLTVTDNGIGIDDEYADKVFVIFQRLHARERYPGTGIGLSLAKKIVEFHGGQIGIDPGDGPGATIRVTLPAPQETAV